MKFLLPTATSLLLANAAIVGVKFTVGGISDKPPADAIAKIGVVTDKSLVPVPLALKNIALP